MTTIELVRQLKNKTGDNVLPGDELTDFRGRKWIFDGVARWPEPGKSGKVRVRQKSSGFHMIMYFTVFGLEEK